MGQLLNPNPLRSTMGNTALPYASEAGHTELKGFE